MFRSCVKYGPTHILQEVMVRIIGQMSRTHAHAHVMKCGLNFKFYVYKYEVIDVS